MTEAKAEAEASNLERVSGEEFVKRAEGYSTSDIKSIAKHMKDEDKSGLFLYLAMASPKGKLDIQQAITNMDETKKFIEQEMNYKNSTVFGSGTDWKANVQRALLKNPLVDGYLADLEKVEPQAKTHFITAMTALYAYRASKKGHGGDMNTIMNDMVQDIIGSSINTLTVRNKFWGNTTVNISKQNYTDSEATDITFALNVINGMGLDASKATAYDAQALVTGDEVLDKTAKAVLDKTNRVNHEANARSAVLHGMLDGNSVAWTYGNVKKSPYSGKFIRDANGRKMAVDLRELLGIIKEADTLTNSWLDPKTNKYKIPGEGHLNPITTDMAALSTRQNARRAALEHLLAKKYAWLNKTDYAKFTKRELAGYIDGVAFYNDVEYDEHGKEIHRKNNKAYYDYKKQHSR